MIPSKVKASEVVWAGAVNYRHLALLSENEKFMAVVSQKLVALGYTEPEYKGISAVTETIEDLVVALEVDAIKDGLRTRHIVHVKMDGFEISLH